MEALRRCGVCSAGLGPKMETCVRCGAPASMAGPPPAPAPTVPTVIIERSEPVGSADACQSCGAKLTPGVAWCGRCLAPITSAAMASAKASGVAAGLDLRGGEGYGRNYSSANEFVPNGSHAAHDLRTTVYASWAERAVASIIDTGATIAIRFLPLYALHRYAAKPVLLATLIATVWFSWWNYYTRQGRTGQTVGKSAMGIKLVSEVDGQPIGSWGCFKRAIVHWIDVVPAGVGYLRPLWHDKSQTFADSVLKTVVVKE